MIAKNGLASEEISSITAFSAIDRAVHSLNEATSILWQKMDGPLIGLLRVLTRLAYNISGTLHNGVRDTYALANLPILL